MARDPFAPVMHQSGPPKWLFIVGGCVAFILIGLASVTYLVVSKRAVAAATPPTPAPVVAPTDPAAPAAPVDKPAPAGDAVAANDKPGAGEDKGEKGEKSGSSRRHHSKSSSSSSSKKSEPAAAKPAAPAPAPKPKKAMDQKEIDKLLGI